ncbi:MAG TPA: YicC/YloC family endoribonuclease [Longimicrobiales bacterium]|nr:YicC/YloC family endoribonuclease [Longimicrobiales bacterium]
MIRSMTGFGEAERDAPAGRLRAEVKTVNHRFFSINIRLPNGLERFEPQVRDWLRTGISRGHINFSLRLTTGEGDAAAPALKLDVARARRYVDIFRAMKEQLGLAGDVDLSLISRFNDVIVRDDEAGPEMEEEDVREATLAAMQALVVMREEEGRRLHDDLEARLAAMERELAVVETHAPERLVAERDRLRNAVAELAEGVSVDEDRLAREIALLADKWDISEETVRLRSHIEHFRALVDEDAAEPVGKRLSFLVQEMHREANTIGSKANDAAIEQRVVGMKNEIERLREQVENVE